MTMMDDKLGKARSNGVSYQELLDTDTHPVPAVLRKVNWDFQGAHDVPVERYTSRAFFELEKEKVWKKVWQMACREEDIPNVGDTLVYDITDISILVVRSGPSTIKAYYNACLHRGRQLREWDGNVHELRCPFHGYAWNLDGSLKHVPAQWDFPQVNEKEFQLPELKVGTWMGWVFVNMDPNCESLESFLGTELTEQFSRWPLDKRFKEAHVARIFRTNWKTVQEAFMEAYHVVATHPQLLAGIGDANSQYDNWGNMSRAITPNGTPSPHLSWVPTQQQMLDAMFDRRIDEPALITLGEGELARAGAAAQSRNFLRAVLGDHVDELCDAELTDSFYYTVFPNFHPWGSYNRIMYRFRPYGDNHEMAIMECMYLSPYNEADGKPPAAKIHWLGPDDDWTEAPELGMLSRVFNQDSFNLPKVQIGMHTLQLNKPGVTLGLYGESKIRHFHNILDQWIAK